MKTIYRIIVAALLLFGVSSCLKDQSILDSSGTNNVIQFSNIGNIGSASASPVPFFTKSYDVVPLDSLVLIVNYAGADYAPEDITVNISLNNDLLPQYNEFANQSFEALPSSVYSLRSSQVTIRKGEKDARFVVDLMPEDFDFEASYALGFTISSSSSGVISGNWGNVVVGISAKNKLDGVYEVTGSLAHATNSSISGLYPKNIHLETLSANQVLYYDADYGMYYHVARSGPTSATYFGNFCAIFEFDEDGTITAVGNAYSPNTQGREGMLDPTGVNKVTFAADGTVETMQVKYFMVQNGVVVLSINETYTYTGAR